METQVIIFLLLFGGVQALLLSLFLVRNKTLSRSGFFLLLYLSVMMLQITLKVMSKVWLMDHWTLLYSISAYLPLLYGPLIYLFVRHLPKDHHVTSRDGIHFIPVVLVFVILALDLYAMLPQILAAVFFHPVFRLSFILLSLVIYHIYAFNIWKNYQTIPYLNADNHKSEWIKQFIILSLTVTSVIAISMFLLYINYPDGHQYRFGFAGLSLFIYWISYNALSRSTVFAVIDGKNGIEPEHNDSPLVLTVYRPSPKYVNSNLKDEEAESICARLLEHMHSAKPYLNPDITINQLADTLQCTRHHLSQVLNDKLHQSYNDYINSLRMDEARRMLQEPQYQQYKIASIAYESGFNSLSTFNDVFKKYVGKTPSEFRKEMLKEVRKQRV